MKGVRLLDSRRLRGRSLSTRVPAAVAEVALEDVEPAVFLACWHRWLSRAATSLKRPELAKGAHARAFSGGLALLVPAPIDVLLAAADLNEWAIDTAADELAGKRTTLSRDSMRRLARRFSEQLDPTLLALDSAARRHDVAFLWDDDDVTLGLGKHARTYPMGELPSSASIDWGAIGRIPVGFVTGTNGKTTTTRWVARMAKAAGRVPGNSSTDGVAIDEHIEAPGDWTGAEAARRILRDERVDFAILETARGGILRRGLAIEGVDAALITNVSADHLGEYGVDDVATMAATKAVVGHAVRPDGHVVLPADDDALAAHWDAFAAERVLFSADPSHPRVSAHLAQGRHAFVISDGRIVHRGAGAEDVLLALNEVPLTFGGNAPHNVKNALAACALAWAMGLPKEAVVSGLRSFGGKPSDNPGRGELHPLPNGAQLLLDFGHNPAAIADLLALAATLGKARRILVTTIAGDRTPQAFAAYATAIARAGVDRVLVWEQASLLRGRAPGETTRLLLEELSRAGLGAQALEAHDSELAAIRSAVREAGPDDVVIATPHMARIPLQALLSDALAVTGADQT